MYFYLGISHHKQSNKFLHFSQFGFHHFFRIPQINSSNVEFRRITHQHSCHHSKPQSHRIGMHKECISRWPPQHEGQLDFQDPSVLTTYVDIFNSSLVVAKMWLRFPLSEHLFVVDTIKSLLWYHLSQTKTLALYVHSWPERHLGDKHLTMCFCTLFQTFLQAIFLAKYLSDTIL